MGYVLEKRFEQCLLSCDRLQCFDNVAFTMVFTSYCRGLCVMIVCAIYYGDIFENNMEIMRGVSICVNQAVIFPWNCLVILSAPLILGAFFRGLRFLMQDLPPVIRGLSTYPTRHSLLAPPICFCQALLGSHPEVKTH